MLGIYPQRWAPAPAGPVCVALWGVNDPGNVGTVLRAALAFGAGSVALGPGTADPYGPKAVRASMGAIFEVPIVRVHEHRRAARATRSRSPPAPAGRLPRSRRTEVTLVVGAEREGLAQGVLDSCNETAHIPIRSESLNAAMAAAIGLYEVTRVARA